MQYPCTSSRCKLPNRHEIHDRVHSITAYYGPSKTVFTLLIIAGSCVILIAYGLYCK